MSAADPAAADRARDLLAALAGVLGMIPGGIAIALHNFAPRPLIRILLATDQALDALAVNRALGERVIMGAEGAWWREARGTWPSLRIVARGPGHEGAPPAEVA